MKLTKQQQGLIRSVKRGAFRDSIGFIELTEKDGKIGWFHHYYDPESLEKIRTLVTFLFNSPLSDLLLYLASQDKLMPYNDELLQVSINHHEQNEEGKECRFYKAYKEHERNRN